MDYKFIILVVLLLFILAYLFRELEASKRDIETKFFEVNENIENNSKTLRTKFQTDLASCTNKLKTYNAEFISQARKISFLNAQPITNMSNNYTETDSDRKNAMQYLSDVRKEKEQHIKQGKPDRQDSLYMSETSSKTNFKIDFNDSVMPCPDQSKPIERLPQELGETNSTGVKSKNPADTKIEIKEKELEKCDETPNDNMKERELEEVALNDSNKKNDLDENNLEEKPLENDEDDDGEGDGEYNEGDGEYNEDDGEDSEGDGEDGESNGKDNDDENNEDDENDNEGEENVSISESVESIEIDMSQYKLPKSGKNSGEQVDQQKVKKEDDNASLNTEEIRSLTGKAFKNIDTYTKKTLEHMAKVFSIPTTYKSKGKRISYRKDELYDKIKAHVTIKNKH